MHVKPLLWSAALAVGGAVALYGGLAFADKVITESRAQSSTDSYTVLRLPDGGAAVRYQLTVRDSSGVYIKFGDEQRKQLTGGQQTNSLNLLGSMTDAGCDAEGL